MSTLGTIRSIGNLRELKGTEGNLKEPCRPMYNYWEPVLGTMQNWKKCSKESFWKRVTQQEKEEENEL